ncbi:MAG: fibrobacter succinogenes major paralogous domain-containing protein [Bacteroidetes bacterium]|nr:fibrobacter succinogenes major paralogous domain-containing protein [Bacteroidota bacterium]
MNLKGLAFFLIIMLMLATVACQNDESYPADENESGLVADVDGNVYHTVTIGSQVWMAENLIVTHFSNGDPIPNITENTDWAALTTPAYCFYENNSSTYGIVYGALYNWYTVDPASNGNKNICPDGWHIPTEAEWTTLTTYLGGSSVAGGKMKEAGTSHWSAPNTGANNSSAFTALPGGYRAYTNGTFDNIGIFAHWWSSTQADASLAWGEGLFTMENPANHSTSMKKNGFSIRCVKD